MVGGGEGFYIFNYIFSFLELICLYAKKYERTNVGKLCVNLLSGCIKDKICFACGRMSES